MPPNSTTPILVLLWPCHSKISQKYSSYLCSLIFPDSSSTVKSLFCISLLYSCLCGRRRSQSDQGRTRRRAVPRASVRGPVPRPWTRRTVPRSGVPGRLCERQVQSHPLMHVLSQYYKHNLLACFTKLHMFLLLKHGWIATPWLVITILWPPRLMSTCDSFYVDVNHARIA